MKNETTGWQKRKFLAVSAQTWIWVVLLVAAFPIVNYYGLPVLFGIAVLLLLGFTFWKSGRAVREDIEKPAPDAPNYGKNYQSNPLLHSSLQSQPGLKTNVHPIAPRTIKKAK